MDEKKKNNGMIKKKLKILDKIEIAYKSHGIN
jgi:hypothetical protein